MFFNVESWRQIGAAAGVPASAFFVKRKKMALKNDKKEKYSAY